MTTLADDFGQLQALNKRFIHNFVTNDVPSHDAILHPEFVAITPAGGYMDRASYLRYWARGFDPDVIVYWDMRDERIAVVGSTALVKATNRWIRRNGQDTATGMTLYTDTYVRTDGGWLCVQAQLTPVAEANYPADSTVVVQYHRGEAVTPGTAFVAA